MFSAGYDARLIHSLALLEIFAFARAEDADSVGLPFFLTPSEADTLLKCALELDPLLVPGLALLLFAGLSFEELELLEHQLTDPDRRVLYIQDTKEGLDLRIVDDLPSALWHWLNPWRGKSGKLLPLDKTNFVERLTQLQRRAFGLKSYWPDERLGFALYGYSFCKNLEKVAHWLDIPPHRLHSLPKLDTEELTACSKEFFSILPPPGYVNCVNAILNAKPFSDLPSDSRLETLVWRYPLETLAGLLEIPLSELKRHCSVRGIRFPDC